MIYLDNNATTKPYQSVIEIVSKTIENNFGNPSSTGYVLGREARKIIDVARTQVADLVNCREDQIVFNSGGTESIYSALLGAAKSNQYTNGLVISNVEHPAVLEASKLINEIFGTDINKIDIKDILNERVELPNNASKSIYSVMYANNETGIINPISYLKAKGSDESFFHSDMVQAVGKIKMSFSELGINSISLSAHKFGGPKGIGALIINDKNPWTPLFTGGGQENGRRGGTENVPLIAGLGEAAKISKEHISNGLQEELSMLRDKFEEMLENEVKNLVIVGKDYPRLPNTSCVIAPEVIGFKVVEELGEKGVLISAGSACKTGNFEPSKNLLAMGYSSTESLGMLRISFNFENTLEDAEKASKIISEVIKNQQKNTQLQVKEILNG